MRVGRILSSQLEAWMGASSLEGVRRRLLRGMTIAFAVLGLPAAVAGSVEAVSQGHPLTGLLYVGLYLPVLAGAVLPRRIPFSVRSVVLLGNLYILALTNLLAYGFTGAGIHILLTMCVLATMLAGGRAGLYGIGMSLVAIVIAGSALSAGWVRVDVLRRTTSTSPVAWATAGVTFLMLSGASVVAAGFVQTSLQRSLERVEEQRMDLRASERKYKLLAESTHDLIITLDLAGRVTYANARAWETLAPAGGEGNTGLLTRRIPTELREPLLERVKDLGSGDEQVMFGTAFVDHAGDRVAAEVTATPIVEEGRATGVLVNVRDVSERKEAEEGFRRVSRQLRAIMDQSPVLMNVFDEHGRYRLVSAATTEVLGLSEEEIVGRRFADVLPPSTAAAFQQRIDRLVGGQRPITVQDRISLEGEERIYESVLFPLGAGEDEALFASIATDVTEQYRMEEQLQHQERLAAVGQLAAGIAHDFRNILATILLYAEMDIKAPDVPERVTDRLQVIVEESYRAADLVQQILDFSSRAMIERRPLDLVELTDNAVEVLRRTIPESTEISLDVEPWAGRGPGVDSPFVVEADSARLRQVLTNLALNARDAMPDGGHLIFSISRLEIARDDAPPTAGVEPGAWVCLEVSDTGTGMTEEAQAHLFEPFFTTKEVGEGTGLGLAQVYGIVRQHDGAISVDTAPGEGTTFRIYLPAHGTDHHE